MNLAEIKAAIPKLSPEELAELDVWLDEQELGATRQRHFRELKRKLEQSYEDVAAGRVYEWTGNTVAEIREEARRQRAAKER